MNNSSLQSSINELIEFKKSIPFKQSELDKIDAIIETLETLKKSKIDIFLDRTKRLGEIANLISKIFYDHYNP